MFVEKRAGKLANLRTALLDGTPSAVVGLAHTRWATHGRPNDLNAHPHTDCSGEITVIHNGIIENFKELRDGLRERGHELVLGHRHGGAGAPRRGGLRRATLPRPLRSALRQAHGAYAVAVMHAREPDRLVGARMNVPLIVGIGEGENFLASDVAAVLAYTRRVIFLEEGDVADIDAERVTITGVDGSPRERLVNEIDWSIEEAEKGGYPHFMLKEMHEQPDAIRAAITGRVHDDTHRARRARAHRRPSGRASTASSSSPAARPTTRAAVGAYVFQDWLHIPARWNVGSEFRYSPPPLDERTLVVAVTQSGETADTIAPTRYARAAGLPDHRGDQHRRLGDHARGGCGPLPPGGTRDRRAWRPRRSPRRSRRLVMLAAAMAKQRGRLPRERERQLVGRAARIARTRPTAALELAEPAKELARRYVNSRGFMFVGRGHRLSRSRSRAR